MRFLLFLLFFPLALSAQIIDFESNTLPKLSVYDSWEASPFRTGRLKGNIAVVDNPDANHPNNYSPRVLAVQRSRYGSNTFGVRIDLPRPIALKPQEQFIQFLIHTPIPSRVMVIGLGKRTERTEQSPEAEQFWAMTPKAVDANSWELVTLPFKGAEGVEIHSLVIVPHCESPHNLSADFAAYIDNIDVMDQHVKLFSEDENTKASTSSPKATEKIDDPQDTVAFLTDANRNGEILMLDGRSLSRVPVPAGKAITLRVRPEAGFTIGGANLHYGFALKGDDAKNSPLREQDIMIFRSEFKPEKGGSTFLLTLPAKCVYGDVRIEGIFVEVDKNGKPVREVFSF